jgi:type VI secretion system protein ImpK
LTAIFFTFDHRLQAQTDAVVSSLQQIQIAQPQLEVVRSGPQSNSRLAKLLAPDIARGCLSVRATAQGTAITQTCSGLFASGQSRVLPDQAPLIRRIGAALQQVPGRVIVIGFTDNQPSARGSPSNWALSIARATEVARLLEGEGKPKEMFAVEGHGDLEPVARGDSSVELARNRRVVILVQDVLGNDEVRLH